MTQLLLHNRKCFVSIVSVLQVVTGVYVTLEPCRANAAPIPAPPAFASPDIKPTFMDWLTGCPMALARKVRLTDPLQKPPFAAAPPDSLKGMAAGIRAVQLDVPNRVKAAAYLGTVDCVTYPEAQDMLIATMQEDPSEEVRYEAVMALRNMLSRGCGNMDSVCQCNDCCNRKKVVRATAKHAKQGNKALIKEAKGPAKAIARKASRESEETRYDCCRGCASEKAMKALVKVATETDEDNCCCVEPSERVRVAAAEALCLFKNYSDGYSLPEDIDTTDGKVDEGEGEKEKEKDKGEVDPVTEKETEANGDKESDTVPAKPSEDKSSQDDSASIPILPTPNRTAVRPAEGKGAALESVPKLPSLKANPEPVGAAIISGLRDRCIVGLKTRQVLPIDPKFSSVYEERVYYFSGAEAKELFDQNPHVYAPAYSGFDPVEWLAKRQMVQGQILREHEDRFYLFVSKENWETFRANPQKYALKKVETKVRLVNGKQ